MRDAKPYGFDEQRREATENHLSSVISPLPSEEPQVLHADDSLLALEKPSGMLSVPGRGEDKRDCLWSWAIREFPDALIVHRLDMATSGIILLARGKAMQSALSRLFAERRVEKQYEAIVAGRLAAAEGRVELPLICDWPNRPRQMVSFEHGKPALTEFRRLNFEGEDRTRVLLLPYTGRSHQLRVHMQAIGHPILGDEFYAKPAERDAAPRLLLHASRLSFAHPVSGREMTLVSEAPFQDYCKMPTGLRRVDAPSPVLPEPRTGGGESPLRRMSWRSATMLQIRYNRRSSY